MFSTTRPTNTLHTNRSSRFNSHQQEVQTDSPSTKQKAAATAAASASQPSPTQLTVSDTVSTKILERLNDNQQPYPKPTEAIETLNKLIQKHYDRLAKITIYDHQLLIDRLTIRIKTMNDLKVYIQQNEKTLEGVSFFGYGEGCNLKAEQNKGISMLDSIIFHKKNEPAEIIRLNSSISLQQHGALAQLENPCITTDKNFASNHFSFTLNKGIVQNADNTIILNAIHSRSDNNLISKNLEKISQEELKVLTNHQSHCMYELIHEPNHFNRWILSLVNQAADLPPDHKLSKTTQHTIAKLSKTKVHYSKNGWVLSQCPPESDSWEIPENPNDPILLRDFQGTQGVIGGGDTLAKMVKERTGVNRKAFVPGRLKSFCHTCNELRIFPKKITQEAIIDTLTAEGILNSQGQLDIKKQVGDETKYLDIGNKEDEKEIKIKLETSIKRLKPQFTDLTIKKDMYTFLFDQLKEIHNSSPVDLIAYESRLIFLNLVLNNAVNKYKTFTFPKEQKSTFTTDTANKIYEYIKDKKNPQMHDEFFKSFNLKYVIQSAGIPENDVEQVEIEILQQMMGIKRFMDKLGLCCDGCDKDISKKDGETIKPFNHMEGPNVDIEIKNISISPPISGKWKEFQKDFQTQFTIALSNINFIDRSEDAPTEMKTNFESYMEALKADIEPDEFSCARLLKYTGDIILMLKEYKASDNLIKHFKDLLESVLNEFDELIKDDILKKVKEIKFKPKYDEDIEKKLPSLYKSRFDYANILNFSYSLLDTPNKSEIAGKFLETAKINLKDPKEKHWLNTYSHISDAPEIKPINRSIPLSERLAAMLSPIDLIYLTGPYGSGKTTAKGLLKEELENEYGYNEDKQHYIENKEVSTKREDNWNPNEFRITLANDSDDSCWKTIEKHVEEETKQNKSITEYNDTTVIEGCICCKDQDKLVASLHETASRGFFNEQQKQNTKVFILEGQGLAPLEEIRRTEQNIFSRVFVKQALMLVDPNEGLYKKSDWEIANQLINFGSKKNTFKNYDEFCDYIEDIEKDPNKIKIISPILKDAEVKNEDMFLYLNRLKNKLASCKQATQLIVNQRKYIIQNNDQNFDQNKLFESILKFVGNVNRDGQVKCDVKCESLIEGRPSLLIGKKEKEKESKTLVNKMTPASQIERGWDPTDQGEGKELKLTPHECKIIKGEEDDFCSAIANAIDKNKLHRFDGNINGLKIQIASNTLYVQEAAINLNLLHQSRIAKLLQELQKTENNTDEIKKILDKLPENIKLPSQRVKGFKNFFWN